MRRLSFRVLFATAATLALSAFTAAPLTRTVRRLQPSALRPFHIVGDVYDVGVLSLDVFLIKTPQGLILIDAGFEQSVQLIEANIRALGFRVKDIRYLVNEHAHIDHAGGLAQLKRDSGAKIVAGARDVATLRAGRVNYGPSADARFEPVSVDLPVHDGDKLSLGGATLTAHATPGHTKGCTSWTLPVVEGGVRHTVIFTCSITVAGNPIAGTKTYPTIAADYRTTFARLKTVKADVVLAPHPGSWDRDAKVARLGKGPNPFIDAGELQRLVAGSEDDFNTQLAKQKAAHK